MRVNLRDETTRLVLNGGIVAAGAVATCGAAGAALAATPLLGAAISAIGGLASNVFATDLHKKLASRLSDPRALLANHDLTRAVGEAIALVLEAEALDRKGAPKSQGVLGLLRRSGSPDARAASVLEAMAKAVPEWWPGFVARNPEIAEGSLSGSPGLTEGQIAAYFSVRAEDRADLRALDPDAWERIVERLAQEAKVVPPEGLLADAAKRLHEQFPLALREIVKEDAVDGGKSYPALVLMVLGDIAGSIKDLQASLDLHEERERERHALLHARTLRGARIDTLQTGMRQRQAPCQAS